MKDSFSSTMDDDDGTLHVDIKVIRDDPKPRRRPAATVSVPPSLMAAIGLGSGDLVVVEVPGASSSAFYVRPVRGDDVTVSLLAARSLGVTDGGGTIAGSKIRKLDFRILPADWIKVSGVAKQGVLKSLAALSLRDAAVKAGSVVAFNFYGKPVDLKVEDVGCGSSSISQRFGEMAVTSTPVKNRNPEGYVMVTDATRVTFADGEEDEAAAAAKKNEDAAAVGGQEKEIETVLGSLSGQRYLGVLIHGPSGVGKTLLGGELAKRLGWRLVRLSGADVFAKFSGETEANLRRAFAGAMDGDGPCVVFVDDVDVLCSSSSGGQERRVCSTLKSLMEELSTATRRVLLLGATNRLSSVDPSLRRSGRFDVELEMAVPDAATRLEIFEGLLAGGGVDMEAVAKETNGYVGADIRAVVGHAAAKARGEPLRAEHLMAALKVVRPSAMREIRIEVPDVRWDDVGGMEGLKLQLKQAVEWPLSRPEAFKRMGISPPKGLLLYGPPGCSKTMVAKALANESRMNFLAIKGPELFSKWVGESEQAVRDLFRKARSVSPAIVFFDEIDALGAERGKGSGKVGDRVLAQMLTEMDGVERLADVVVVAATNRPDMIDPALMRPGRLDRIVHVPLPDRPTRLEILRVHTARKPLDVGVDLAEVAERTEGYSGAEVAAVCNEAALKALEEMIEGREEEGLASACIEQRHFEAALTVVKARTTPELLNIYREFSKT